MDKYLKIIRYYSFIAICAATLVSCSMTDKILFLSDAARNPYAPENMIPPGEIFVSAKTAPSPEEKTKKISDTQKTEIKKQDTRISAALTDSTSTVALKDSSPHHLKKRHTKTSDSGDTILLMPILIVESTKAFERVEKSPNYQDMIKRLKKKKKSRKKGTSNASSGSRKQKTEKYAQIHQDKPIENEKNFWDEYSRKFGIDFKGTENRALIAAIGRWMGTIYKSGGCSLKGVDCSCLVKKVYQKAFNVDLGRYSATIFSRLKRVDKKQLKEGDILSFNIEGNRGYHLGIYLRDNKFVHASSKKGVKVNDIRDVYFRKRFVAAGRYQPDTRKPDTDRADTESMEISRADHGDAGQGS